MTRPPSSISRANLDYIDQLFQQYKNNPSSVHPDWKLFFDGVELASSLDKGSFSKGELQVFNLINTYREDGHLKAHLNPLNSSPIQSFELSYFDLTKEDCDKKFEVFHFVEKNITSLKELISFLEKTYCSTLALQVGGCDPKIRQWFFQKFEQEKFSLSPTLKKKIFEKLVHVEAFEKFLNNRFLGAKRFSIEGSDALIAMLEYLADQSSSSKFEELAIGMSHRGRLNVMVNFMNQPHELVFSQFEGEVFVEMGFTGDVKYHIGYSSQKSTLSNHKCNVLLGFNPSHLESIAPVISGVTRARQRMLQDTNERQKVIPVLIHGDAAFCGQGVVSETLQLSKLEGYRIGGSIHIIVNNQVGFTTNPEEGRSSLYAADLAKSIDAPILLVNGDDVENCIRAMDLALQFRNKFKQDVVIDLISYRRHGHNEGDEPAFTQPLMYEKIKKHPTLMKIYEKQLLQADILKEKDASTLFKNHTEHLQKILDGIRKKPFPITESQMRGTIWPYNKKPTPEELEEPVNTTTKEKTLDKVLTALTEEPTDFNLHPKIQKLIQQRKKLVDSKQLDWALAELAAYGTLCLEGHPVRLSGQDSKRGTFSHRQACYFDTKNAKEYIPLTQLDSQQQEFCIYNSPLSEVAVLGFEYGNSCSDHNSLTLWEAQFGDFANGAQVIIDQYISSGEEKWLQSCSLTLLLPHGYEGQGPEHSSARLERFLQLCAQYNMQVCYPTTPANLFHVLRRQVKRDAFKPLILMTPKSLLRHPKMISNKQEFLKGTFKEIIAPEIPNSKEVRTLILCSGKVYFDLMEKQNQIPSHAIPIRLEQIYPFPKKHLNPYLNGLPHLEKIIWLQEEPQNMGAYSLVQFELQNLLEEIGKESIVTEYVGRSRKASPAEGSSQVHKKEQDRVIQTVLAKTKI